MERDAILHHSTYENGGPSVSVEQRRVKGTEFLPVYEIIKQDSLD